MNKLIFFVLLLINSICFGQREPDQVYMKNIHGVKLFQAGNQLGYPMIDLGALEGLELHFDDFDGFVKNYNYTFQLCNADWQPADINVFDYLKGFTQNRLSQYRVSSISKTVYVHYQVRLPEKNCMPVKSGNYLLKVFLNGDTSKLAFTRRVLIFDKLVNIGAQVQQPFNSRLFQTHQKVQFSVDKTKLNIMNPQQQLKVVVLQNYRWDNAVKNMQPAFMRQNVYEYNGEKDFIFPAGKEYRWIDLLSFRFQSDRVRSVNKTTVPFEVEVAPDGPRIQERYLWYRDLNGFFEINSSDLINPWWQGDYANVHFTFIPNGKLPFAQDLYIGGEMTGYLYNDSTKMEFNETKGVYEKTLLLKQGYYSYTYFTKDAKKPNAVADVTLTDGNYWETENDYTILVYYRSFSDRADELVGVSTINSRTSRSRILIYYKFLWLFKWQTLYLRPAGLTRPAPAEPSQGRKAARVGGCSGAM